jgi:hypothetical protein
MLLSPKAAELTRSYFERRPWRENDEAHRRLKDQNRGPGTGA